MNAHVSLRHLAAVRRPHGVGSAEAARPRVRVPARFRRADFRRLAVVGLMAAGAGSLALPAAAVSFTFRPLVDIPDGRSSGLADVRSVTGVAPGSSLEVGISLSGVGSGMINGDLYAFLEHEDAAGTVDAFVVLLNRPGKRAGNEDGYFDNGLSVVFAPVPGLPDIHTYRLVTGGDHGVPLRGALGGVWSPDGRETDPDAVLDTDARTTSLDVVQRIDANDGLWTLFVADMVPGGNARLAEWSLSFTSPGLPDSTSVAWAAALVALGWWVARPGVRRGAGNG